MRNKRLIIVLAIVAVLLAVPLIAMQFTSEVKWGIFDFLVMGILLLVTGFGIEFVLRKITKPTTRLAVCLAIGVVFVLVWAELAVGIFGTPLAGS